MLLGIAGALTQEGLRALFPETQVQRGVQIESSVLPVETPRVIPVGSQRAPMPIPHNRAPRRYFWGPILQSPHLSKIFVALPRGCLRKPSEMCWLAGDYFLLRLV